MMMAAAFGEGSSYVIYYQGDGEARGKKDNKLPEFR